MYSASATFNTLIKAKERTFTYSGSIVTTGGTTYDFYGSDMRSGKLIRSICDDSIEIGTVYASEFDCELALSVSRYELYGATITLNIMLEGATDVIPMGIFTIAEVNQTSDRLQIKAYDAMVKFDAVSFSAATETSIQSPYVWLSQACTACGVTLAMTSAQIEGLPNGVRRIGFADAVTDVKTWRDVLRYLSAYLGSYAYIGRDGELYLGQFGTVSADTIQANFRYTSGLSDFRTTYDGLYAIYKDGGVQEYVPNTNSGGIILDLGINPFLQINNDTNRQAALQEIIDSFNGVYYVPYSSDIPMNPLYDCGDVITFTGNQADAYDYGAITEIILTIGNQMHITCAGDNPILAAAQDRFTKSVAGLSEEYNNGQAIGTKDFWLIETSNTNSITVGSTKTQVTEIEFEQKTDVQKVGLMFTCEGQLSATAVVDLEITVDDEASYTFDVTEEKAGKGKRIFTADCGFRVLGKGTHTAKVYLTVTDNSLKWSDLV